MGEGKLRPVGRGGVQVWAKDNLGSGTSCEKLARLLQDGRFRAAMVLLAYALPEREAVWWGCKSVGWAVRRSPDQDRDALAAAANWVRAPGPDTRLACMAAGKRADAGSPAAAIAFAAFGARPEKVLHSLAGRWTHVAFERALYLTAEGERDARSKGFIASAVDIAAGGAGRLAS